MEPLERIRLLKKNLKSMLSIWVFPLSMINYLKQYYLIFGGFKIQTILQKNMQDHEKYLTPQRKDI